MPHNLCRGTGLQSIACIVRVCVCMHACVSACVHACVRVCSLSVCIDTRYGVCNRHVKIELFISCVCLTENPSFVLCTYYPVHPHFTQYTHTLPSAPTLYPVHPHYTQCTHTIPSAPTLYPVHPHYTQCTNTLPSTPTLYPVHPHYTQCTHTIPSAPTPYPVHSRWPVHLSTV